VRLGKHSFTSRAEEAHGGFKRAGSCVTMNKLMLATQVSRPTKYDGCLPVSSFAPNTRAVGAGSKAVFRRQRSQYSYAEQPDCFTVCRFDLDFHTNALHGFEHNPLVAVLSIDTPATSHRRGQSLSQDSAQGYQSYVAEVARGPVSLAAISKSHSRLPKGLFG
jgi:hypothetical protein